MSHPQALGQCRHWLKAHGIHQVSYPDTAGAAAFVAERRDPAIAALAPPGAAALYGLNLLAVDIRRCGSQHHALRRAGARRQAAGGRRAVDDDADLRGEERPSRTLQGDGRLRDQRRQHDQAGKLPAVGLVRATEFYPTPMSRASPANPAFDRAMEELGFHSKWLRLLGTYHRARERG